MNKKLQSKDEKKVEGWEKTFDDNFNVYKHGTFWVQNWGKDDLTWKLDTDRIKDFIISLLAQSRKSWQEEQNRVVNSGRKLFQEGQKAERERIVGEVEKRTLNLQTVWMQSFIDTKKGREPTPHSQFWDGGVKALAELMTILHVLKGDND